MQNLPFDGLVADRVMFRITYVQGMTRSPVRASIGRFCRSFDAARYRGSMPDAGASPPGPAWLESIRCSFCGKRGTEAEKIVAGSTPGVAICNECIVLCAEIIAEERGADGPPDAAA
jgi:ClpX C4-type zinc finger protein